MATTTYNRSEVLNFHDLTDKQQQDVLDNYYQDREEAEQDRFVIFQAKKREYDAALPLSQFMRTTGSKLWDGIFGTSYFSAYFIKLNKSRDGALIAEKHI